MPSILEQLITALTDKDTPTPHTLLNALSGLKEPEIERFLPVWSRLPEPRRRQIIARLLEINEDDVTLDFEEILYRLLDDSDAEVRRQAIGGLWESENTSLIRIFTRMLHNDTDVTVQAAAAQALGKYSVWVETDRLRASYREKLAATLLAVFHDTSRAVVVRRRALESLAPLNTPGVKEAIDEACRNPEKQLNIGALYAMGATCHADWQNILRRELNNADAEYRYEAAAALGQIGQPEDAPLLAKLTADPDLEVSLAAIRSLGIIGGDAAKKSLRECLENPNETLRQAAVQAMAEIKAAADPLAFEF
jgi:HEAT repeat protein